MQTVIKILRASVMATLLLGVPFTANANNDTAADAQKKGSKAPVTEVKKDKPQTTCPVMGGAINKSVYTDYQGKRIYFCCPGCIETFKKDAAKFMKQMADQGIKLEDAPPVK